MNARRDALNALQFDKLSHAGLALDRYVTHLGSDETSISARKTLFEAMVGSGVSTVYREAYKRWKQMLTSMDCVQAHECLLQRAVKTGEVEIADRMLIGMGNEGVLETNITLQRVYGVPYIPGSALKGLCRHYVQHHLKESPDLNILLHVLSGSTDAAGYITFFDAWFVPESAQGKPLGMDVLTPHHPEYYSSDGKNGWPSDFNDPNPVRYVSAKGKYLVAIQGPNREWTDQAWKLLIRALEDWGVGGKTSSGYGRIKRVPVKEDGAKSETERSEWKNVLVQYDASRQILSVTHQNKKAISTPEVTKKTMDALSQEARDRVKKKKSMTANVTVEIKGNSYIIIDVKPV